jgi:hypothetical protein
MRLRIWFAIAGVWIGSLVPAQAGVALSPDSTSLHVPVPSKKTTAEFREVNEPLPYLVHNKETYSPATLVKVSETEGFVRVNAGLLRISLTELPDSVRAKYYDMKLIAERAEKQAQRVQAAKEEKERLAVTQKHMETEALFERAKAAREARGEPEHPTSRAEQSAPDPDSSSVGAVMVILFGLFIYFLPSFVGRKQRNVNAIFALNLLLGWTFVGWVLALVWALYREKPNPSSLQLGTSVGGPKNPSVQPQRDGVDEPVHTQKNT